MSLLAVGLNHRTASSGLLERLAIAPEDQPKVLHDLVAGEHVSEAVLLATCNRVEVYAESATFHGGVTEVADVLARAGGVPAEQLHASLYVHHEARAVQHLFSVVCGLDSMLVGEAQILGQVRSAYRRADEAGTAGRALGALFREALRVGKRAHSETGIDAAAASVVSVALQLAAEELGDLTGRSVLLVGAGSTGGLAGSLLRKAGVGTVVIANRTPERSQRLAATLRGRSIGLGELVDGLAAADLVVSATGSTLPVVSREAVAAALDRRSGRPLVLVDLGLPRDVEVDVRELAGVTVIDLEGLRTVLSSAAVGADVDAVRGIVADEVAGFLSRQRALRVAPTVVALRARASEVVAGELARLSGRVPQLSERERAEVESTVRRVVDKLLHAPTVRVKELADSPDGDRYARALQELFELDPRTAEAVSAPDPQELP